MMPPRLYFYNQLYQFDYARCCYANMKCCQAVEKSDWSMSTFWQIEAEKLLARLLCWKQVFELTEELEVHLNSKVYHPVKPLCYQDKSFSERYEGFYEVNGI